MAPRGLPEHGRARPDASQLGRTPRGQATARLSGLSRGRTGSEDDELGSVAGAELHHRAGDVGTRGGGADDEMVAGTTSCDAPLDYFLRDFCTTNATTSSMARPAKMTV